MVGGKRTRAEILGQQRSDQAAVALGARVRAARKRRRLTQAALGRTVGISRQRLGDLESGRGAGTPPEVWFALAEALGIYLRFEFGRDPQAELDDAGHLQIQELVLRLAKAAGCWERAFEAGSRAWGSQRSVDIRLLDRKGRRLVIGECWNTFGDLGAASRSSTHKVRDAQQQAVAIGGEGEPFAVGLVWIVCDSAANRSLVARYAHIFASRFPGSSSAWVKAITKGGPMPTQPGLVWCAVRATRLFAHRRARGTLE
jgi:transcriptional regulator with XRE-family HTH domain